LGTACTPEHVHKLFRFTDAVVFSFDGDAAGQRAARKALDAALPHANDLRSVKFLFLPPEHDPDSYIRSQGAPAFAQQVNEAMPLSRFLIEAASEGCSLRSAEGRARLASQAQPLWSALPDGALKRQLLTEIAHLVQLDSRELIQVWQGQAIAAPAYNRDPRAPTAHHAPNYTRSAEAWGNGSGPSGFKTKFFKPTALRHAGSGAAGGLRSNWDGNRLQPASRADHAVRLLLSHMAGWGQLTEEDHALLCELPAPHGPLFIWLDSVFQDQGPLLPGALREALRGLPFEDLALTALTGLPAHDPAAASATHASPAHATHAPGEAERELRALIDLILNDKLKELENQAVTTGDLARYRQLHERRRLLTQQLAQHPH
jgi:DNA primase